MGSNAVYCCILEYVETRRRAYLYIIMLQKIALLMSSKTRTKSNDILLKMASLQGFRHTFFFVTLYHSLHLIFTAACREKYEKGTFAHDRRTHR